MPDLTAIDRQLFNQRLLARLLGVFAGLGLGLACIGFYELLSYEVTSRICEIGVHTALDAQRKDVLALFLRRGLAVVLRGSGGCRCGRAGDTAAGECALWGEAVGSGNLSVCVSAAEWSRAGGVLSADVARDACGSGRGATLRVMWSGWRRRMDRR